MNRRTFVKSTASMGLLTVITPHAIIQALPGINGSSLTTDFLNPPAYAKPQTWWHWMNGNITKRGITMDLEAMKEAGLGGFQLFDAGTGITKGPVEYLSPQWLDLMNYTIQESKRLDLDFAMHNCPGWSSSGGPWITPEKSMQQITWSEWIVKGGKQVEIKLPKPVSHLEFYRDAHIIAFPSLKGEEKNLEEIIQRVSTNTGVVKKEKFLEMNGDELIIEPTGNEPGFLLFEMKAPLPLKNITLFTRIIEGGGAFKIEISNNGKTFQDLGSFTGGSGNNMIEGKMPSTAQFPLTETKFIKLKSEGKRAVSHISFSGADRNLDWLKKANYRNHGWGESKAENEINKQSIIDPSMVIDLSSYVDVNGNLNWNAPQGNWTILRIGHTSIGKLNHSAPTTGTGLECDKYSKEAFNFHWNHMFQDYLEPLQEMAREGKVGLLIDSYEMGLQNWTENMPEEFKLRRKYDLLNFLPALTGRIVEGPESTNRFLWDFRRTCADMMADNYHGEFDRLCKKYGFQSYTEPYGGGPMEEMQVGSRVDFNMGEFWSGHTVLWANIGMKRTMKLASSIAHADNVTIVGAEAFTAEPGAGKWQQYPYSMKALGDWMFTEGLTRIIFHRYAHQPHPSAVPGMTMGPWGIHFERTNTWWEQGKSWLDYLSRTQYLLQQGKFVADLAFLTSEEPGISIPTMADQLSHTPPYGFDYDLISSETLQKTKLIDGRLAVDGGMQYKVLILPEEDLMTLSTLKKISALVKDGLTLVGKRPQNHAGLLRAEDSEVFRNLVLETWGQNSGVGEGITNNKGGKVFENKSLAKVLQELNLKPDFSYSSESNDAPINFIHRKTNDGDIYFIANRRRTSEKLICTFRVSGKQPEFWDPTTGKQYKIPVFSISGEGVTLPINLPPAGSMFIVFNEEAPANPVTSLSLEGKNILSTSPFSNKKNGLYPNVFENFSIGVWVKPETDIPLTEDQFFGKTKTDHFAIYPPSGKELYGEGHVTSGLTVGRNGIVLFEREEDELNSVFSIPVAIEGWSHILIEYQENAPRIFINGKFTKEGKARDKIVHPGLNEAFQTDGASYYNGDMSLPNLLPFPVQSGQLQQIIAAGVPKDNSWEDPFFYEDNSIILSKNGNYTLQRARSGTKKLKISGTGEIANLNKDWEVSFPDNSGAPKRINLPELISLHKHSSEGVKHFSGTASYNKKFSLPDLQNQKGHRLFLNLGKIEVIAEVIVNNKSLGILWKPPYTFDITDFLRKGENELNINVTNLWPNRLIGDEKLPAENDYEVVEWPGKFRVLAEGAIKSLPDWYKEGKPKPLGGRTTFTTWKHYNEDSPLLESGLIGPVVIQSVYKETLRDS